MPEINFGEINLSEVPECWRDLCLMHFSLKAKSKWRIAFASGVPATMGSKKGFAVKGKAGGARAGRWFGVVVDDNPDKLSKYQNDMRVSMRRADTYNDKWAGPVETGLVALMGRPKSHFRAGRFSHLLKNDAPTFPTVKPDLDKILRATWDCGTGIWWIDDSQCVSCPSLKKIYVPDANYEPGVIFYARALPEEESGRVF